MEIESSIVASQNALGINPSVREPQRDADARHQQQQRSVTEHPKTQVVIRQGNTEAFKQADNYREQRAIYDQPDSRGRNAIQAYQSLQRQSQQENIHTSLGVDTYV